jgi:hypothetical protein
MLTDLMIALELVMAALASMSVPEKKRHRVAKQLLKVYLGIEAVIERGQEILSYLRSEGTLTHDVALNVLLEQQRAFEDLVSHLKDESLSSLLGLHLPEFGPLSFLTDPNEDEIICFFSQLTAISDFEQERHEFLYELALDQESPEGHPRVEVPATTLSESYPSGLSHLPGQRSRSVRVFSTSQQVEEADAVLAKMSQLRERLRRYLIGRFEFQDML